MEGDCSPLSPAPHSSPSTGRGIQRDMHKQPDLPHNEIAPQLILFYTNALPNNFTLSLKVPYAYVVVIISQKVKSASLNIFAIFAGCFCRATPFLCMAEIIIASIPTSLVGESCHISYR